MILELPGSDVTRGRHHRLGFYHFSNNNLAVRRQCAVDLGLYDPEQTSSEDVDLCIRSALHPDWVACREPGVVIRHRPRPDLGGLLRQMWTWSIRLPRAFAKTGARGIYLHWVDERSRSIGAALELRRLPGLVVVFATVFHALVASAALALVLGTAGFGLPAGLAVLAAAYFAQRCFRFVWATGFSRREKLGLAAVQALASSVFVAGAFVGGLRVGVLFVAASVFPPRRRPEP